MAEPNSRNPRVADVPPENFMISPGEPHMEIMDTRTQQVWQSLAPVTRDDYKTMAIDARYRRVGLGFGTMDEHCFRRSPDTEQDGPMEFATFDGREFGRCARPDSAPSQPSGPDGPTLLTVHKYHTLVFYPGRSVDVATAADGADYIHVIEGGAEKAPLALPEGWTLRTMEITEERIVDLPARATVWFFPNGDSFQGPL